jgi:N-acetylmuramoyl-L-alanine amidase
MKKAALILVVVLFTAFPLFAEKVSQVSLRFASQGDHTRIVLESDDESVNGASAAASASGIRVTFPSEFEIRKPDNFNFGIVKEGRSMTINLRDVTDVKMLKLRSPARLVFDLAQARPPIGAGVPQVSPSGEQGAVKQPGQKSLKDLFQNLLQKTPEKPQFRVIVIDAGHGGYDYGIVTQESKEKDVDLTLARALNAAFSKQGETAFLTRKSDQSASIAERIDFANGKKPDLFISIHASSSTDRFAVYVSTVNDLNVDPVAKQYSMFSAQNKYFDESRKIAHTIGESLKSKFGNTVVIRELPLPILYSMNAPAVLIEYPSMDLFGRAQSMQNKFASSVADGISAYENR